MMFSFPEFVLLDAFSISTSPSDIPGNFCEEARVDRGIEQKKSLFFLENSNEILVFSHPSSFRAGFSVEKY